MELCSIQVSSTIATSSSPTVSKFRPVQDQTDVSPGVDGKPGGPGAAGPKGVGGTIQACFGEACHVYSGSSGNDGKKGSEGTDNTYQPVTGIANIASYSETDIGGWALCISPAFLQMLVQRLLFEYDVLFGSFFDVEAGQNKSVERLRFEYSFSWLSFLCDSISKFESSPDMVDIVPDSAVTTLSEAQKTQEQFLRVVFGGQAWKNSPELIAARKILTISYGKLSSLGGSVLPPLPSTDSYNQSFRLIPDISLSMKRLEQAASDMEVVEARRAVLAAEVAHADWDASQTADKIQQYSDYIAKITPERATAQAQVDKAMEEAKKQSSALQSQVKLADSELKNLEPSDFPNLSCQNVSKILEAAATCMMFTPEAAGTALAGNMMYVGGAASSLITTVHTEGQGDVKREVLMGQFSSIDDKLEGKDLSDAIGSIASGSGSDNFMNVIMVAKSKFDALVDANFPGTASAEARKVWDLMMQQANQAHQALIQYQKSLLNQAQVEAYFIQARLAKDFAASDTSTTPSVKSQVFRQLYDESYAQQKALVVKYYLDAIRAIVSIKLEPILLPHSIISLGCWDNLTGSLFNEVILPQLRLENDILMKMDDSLSPEQTNYIGYITKEDYPYIFGYEKQPARTGNQPSLVKKGTLRPFNFMIDSTNCHQILNIDLKSQCDVRMIQCRVALEGAVLKKEQDMDPVISVNTAFSGGFYVTTGETKDVIDNLTGETKQQDVEYMFEIDHVTTGCRYQYDKKDPKKIIWRSQDSNPYARMVALDDLRKILRPVQSPLANWSISWDEDAVDVSQVERIRLEVQSCYRPRKVEIPNTNNLITKSPVKLMTMVAPMTPPKVGSSKNSATVADAEVVGIPMDPIASIHDPQTYLWQPQDSVASPLTKTTSPFLNLVNLPDVGGALNGILLKLEQLRTYQRSSTVNSAVTGMISFFIPNGFTEQQAINPRAFKSFDTLGTDPQQRIDNMAKDPGSEQVISGLKNLVEELSSQFDSLSEETRFTTYLADWANGTWHSAINASMSTIPQDVADKIGGDYAKYGEAILLSRFKAIPVGATVLVEPHAEAVRNASNAVEKIFYCWSSRKQILEDEKTYLATGKSIKGLVIQLGYSGLIAYDDCKVIENGEKIIIQACAYTMSWHTLYGGNSWITAFSKSDPTRVLCANYMEGQGRIRTAEKVNCFVGEPLMLRAQKDFPLFLVAVVMGKKVDDVLKTRSDQFRKDFQRARSWFQVLDKGGIGMAGIRALLGGNSKYDQYNTLELSFKDDVELATQLQDKSPEDEENSHNSTMNTFSKSLPCGMALGGFRFNPVAWALPGVNMELLGPLTSTGLTDSQLSLARTKTQHALGLFYTSQTNREAFRNAVISITQQLQADVMTQDPTLNRLSPRDILQNIKNDILYIIRIRGAVSSIILKSDEFMSQIGTELQNDPLFADFNVYDLELVLDSVNNLDVYDRILADGGLADTYVYGELVSSGVNRLTAAECVAMITQCNTDLEAQTKLVNDAQKALESIDKTKVEDVEKAQFRVNELEGKVNSLEKQQESYASVEKEYSNQTEAATVRKSNEEAKENEIADLAK